jgi:hypothetical protein
MKQHAQAKAEKILIHPKMLVIWTYHMLGYAAVDIAALVGVHRNTVRIQVDKMAELLDIELDVDKVRQSMLQLVPHALIGLQKAFDRGDGPTIANFLQEMKIYLGKAAGAAENSVPLTLNVNINEVRQQKMREGLEKLNVVVSGNMG